MSKPKYDCFDVEIENNIAHIRMNRPEKLNSMNKAFWNDLPEIVEDIDHNARARVIVISSTGRHFSAGMDLSVFAPDPNNKIEEADRHIAAELFRSNVKYIQHSFNALEEARIPVLFALHGGVIGGAIDMVTAGDIRWCTTDAFFCIQETNIGMTADVGTFPRLQRYISEGWVKEMAYTGRRIDAATAKDIGLVNDVFETQDECLAHVMETAKEIASKSPLAVTGCKALINYGRDHNTADTLDYIGVWNAGMFPPAHIQEAVAAIGQKREANFPDLLPVKTTPM